jgi:hypothetical protein
VGLGKTGRNIPVASILGGDEMVQPTNESTREELLALTPSGDLMDLARRLREQGVESLLICRPDGRITQVVTDRQIASLASVEPSSLLRFDTPHPVGTAQRFVRSERPVVPQSRRPDDDLMPVDRSGRSPEGEGVGRQTG